MNIGSYITLESDEKLKQFRCERNSLTYRYTMSGAIFFSFDAAIPVIIKRRGCVGLAQVREQLVTPTATTVVFSIVASDEDYTAIYNQYLLTASNARDNNDPYQTDQLIPGTGVAGIGKRLGAKDPYDDYDDDDDFYR